MIRGVRCSEKSKKYYRASSGVTHLCDQCAFATADIDVLLQHYDGCHSLINLKGAPAHVKAEEQDGGGSGPDKEAGQEYSCTKCHFITEVEEEIFRHYRSARVGVSDVFEVL